MCMFYKCTPIWYFCNMHGLYGLFFLPQDEIIYESINQGASWKLQARISSIRIVSVYDKPGPARLLHLQKNFAQPCIFNQSSTRKFAHLAQICCLNTGNIHSNTFFFYSKNATYEFTHFKRIHHAYLYSSSDPFFVYAGIRNGDSGCISASCFLPLSKTMPVGELDM